MNENEKEILEDTVPEKDDPILPDGWAEGDDFFDEKSWSANSGEDEDSDEDEDFFADTDEEIEDEPSEDGETVESGSTKTETAEPETEAEETAEEEEPSTTEATEPPAVTEGNKLKFKARIDHEDVDAEIDESELPTLYQKATATDRYQAKLAKINPTFARMERMAKQNGYGSVEEMLDAQEAYERDEAITKLVNQGTPKEIAEDYVDRRFNRSATSEFTQDVEPTATPDSDDTGAVETEQEAPVRDFAAEVRDLWTMRPDLKGTTLPSEVAAAAANGQNLTLAYFAYEAKLNKAEAERLRQENNVMKQNAASAAKGPVKGVTGGGATDTKPKDPFLAGFDSEW